MSSEWDLHEFSRGRWFTRFFFTSAHLPFRRCGRPKKAAAGYRRQPSGNAATSVIAAAGLPGSFRYSFSAPVAVSVTRIT